MKKVFIYDATPCGRRKIDSKKLSNYFLKNKYQIVGDPKIADLIILNTCAYSDERAEFSINKVKEFQQFKAELIVVGCLPGIEKEKLRKNFSGKIISTKDLDKIDEFFLDHNIKYSDVKDEITFWSNFNEKKLLIMQRKLLENKFFKKIVNLDFFKKILGIEFYLFSIQREDVAHIRIAYGCPANCSYCAIKKAIGPLKSKPLEECINEFKEGLQRGFKKFFITADDVGSYGIDIGKTFIQLLNEFISFNEEFTIGIESLRPVWIIKFGNELEKIVKTGKIEFIGCSVQSGSEKILRKMNRYPNIKKIKEKLLKLKKVYPKLILITEIIVGFPGETFEDFEETCNLLKEIAFDLGYIYRYSDRSGTIAEKIVPKVSEKELDKRVKIIKKLLKNMGYRVRYKRNKTVLVFSR